MSTKKASAILSMLGALCLVVLLGLPGGNRYEVSADPPAPSRRNSNPGNPVQRNPLAQSPEEFVSSSTCECRKNGRVYQCGELCGDRVNLDSCTYSQEICTTNRTCEAQLGFEPSTKVCRPGAPCDPPDMCDGKGECVEQSKFSCPADETCRTYQCSSDYTAKQCLSVTRPKVNAVCSSRPEAFECGELYWVRVSEVSPPQCGGEECAEDYQRQADPCELITCIGSEHFREFGASNQEFSYVCRDAVGVDVTRLMTTRGRFRDGPARRAQAGRTYEVPFARAPERKNYRVTTVPAKVTVTKKPVRCRVNDAVKMYNEPNPPFTFRCDAFVDPDTENSIFETRVPTTDAVRDSPVGRYPIRLTAPPSDNYLIAVVEGTLEIRPAPLTCRTSNLTLTPGITFSQAFVSSGFSVSNGVSAVPGRWTFLDINDRPMNFGTRPWSPSTITVKGTFTPDPANYTPVSCQLNIAVRQCTAATVAQDCTEDDGNACTDPACNEETGQCYHKFKEPTTSGALNAKLTLICPNTTQVEFDDIFACVDPENATALYRVGIGTSPVSYNGNRGSLIGMNNTIVARSACSHGRCRFTTTEIVFARESSPGVPPRISPPLHAGVAALAGGRLLSEARDSKTVQCPYLPCNGKTCAEGTLNTTTCECESQVLCGNGRLDPGEQCDPNIPRQPLPPGCDASKQFTCTPDCKWQANPDLCPYGCPNSPKCWFHDRHTNSDGLTGHDIFAYQNSWDDPCCCPRSGISPSVPHLKHCQESGELPGAHPSFDGGANTPERFVPGGATVYPSGALIGDYKQKYVPFEITSACPYGGAMTCEVWDPSGGALVCEGSKATFVCGCVK